MLLNELKKFVPKIDKQFFQTKEETLDWIIERGLASTRDLERGEIKLDRELMWHPTSDVDFDRYDNKRPRITEFKIQFYIAPKTFSCIDQELTTLKGSPRVCFDSFNVSGNRLKNLKGGPKIVSGTYDVRNNELTSLEGIPEKLTKEFKCQHNKLTSIKDLPLELEWLHIQNNPIKGFKGIHQIVHSLTYLVVDENQMKHGGFMDILKINGLELLYVLKADGKQIKELNEKVAAWIDGGKKKSELLGLQNYIIDEMDWKS
jgi:hypothetical protein